MFGEVYTMDIFPNFQNRDIIISETDPYGTILYANDNFCAISGFSMEELVGSPHKIIRHPSMPKELFHFLWATLRKGEVFRGIIKNQTKDQLHYWVNSTILPVFENGKVVKYTAGRHLITDDKLAEELYNLQAQKYGWKI